MEVVAFILIGSTHEYQQSTFWSSANRIVAGANNLRCSTAEYLHLREDNMQLAQENAFLKAQLMKVSNEKEPLQEREDQYIYSHLDWEYIPAKVIDISTNKQHNYLTINKGSRDGIEKDMGVVCATGVVGIISTTSEKYSLVVPLIHTEISISSRLKTNGQIGGTQWTGKDYRYIDLTYIARHIEVNQGDTVVTSGLTSVFPENLMIGIVHKTQLKETDNYHSTSVELSTDYRSIKYVQVLRNNNKEQHNGMDQSNH